MQHIAILHYKFKKTKAVYVVIYQYLKELKQLGLIKGNIKGTSVCYCIDIDNWMKIKSVLILFFNHDILVKNCK